jgi:hypothetical protein
MPSRRRRGVSPRFRGSSGTYRLLKTYLPVNRSVFGSGLILKNRFWESRIFLRITVHHFGNNDNLPVFLRTEPNCGPKNELNIALPAVDRSFFAWGAREMKRKGGFGRGSPTESQLPPSISFCRVNLHYQVFLPPGPYPAMESPVFYYARPGIRKNSSKMFKINFC